MRDLERGAQPGWSGAQCRRELCRLDAQVVERYAVESLRVLAHRGITALAHLGQDLAHRVGGRDLAVVRAGQAGAQVVDATEVEPGEHEPFDGSGTGSRVDRAFRTEAHRRGARMPDR